MIVTRTVNRGEGKVGRRRGFRVGLELVISFGNFMSLDFRKWVVSSSYEMKVINLSSNLTVSIVMSTQTIILENKI